MSDGIKNKKRAEDSIEDILAAVNCYASCEIHHKNFSEKLFLTSQIFCTVLLYPQTKSGILWIQPGHAAATWIFFAAR